MADDGCDCRMTSSPVMSEDCILAFNNLLYALLFYIGICSVAITVGVIHFVRGSQILKKLCISKRVTEDKPESESTASVEMRKKQNDQIKNTSKLILRPPPWPPQTSNPKTTEETSCEEKEPIPYKPFSSTNPLFQASGETSSEI